MKKKIKSQILFSVILIGIIQAAFVLEWEFMTYLTAAISYILIAIMWELFGKVYIKYDFECRGVVYFYLLLGITAIVRGFFEAENYWDWKEFILSSALVMMLPFVSCIGSSKEVTQLMYQTFLKYLVPFSVFVFFAAKISENTDGFARFLSPIYIIILFFPVLSGKWKLIITFIVVCSFFSDLGSRSNLIRIIASCGIMSIYYFKALISHKMMEILRMVLFAGPLILFIMAVNGTFNIFKVGDNFNEDNYTISTKLGNGEEREDVLTADTRTFLYEEVIASGIKRNTWLIGESAVGGYISESFSEEILGSKGRTGSEVGILNVFNSLGVIGLIGFTLIFYYASFLCVNRSENDICKLLGLFIAFRWTYSWVEEFTNFDMNYIFLWLTIGLCFSKSFRQMDNKEMVQWIWGIFDFHSRGHQFINRSRRSKSAIS